MSAISTNRVSRTTHELSVIVTSESDSKLKQYIESLRQGAGYGIGIEVCEIKSVPGKYVLIIHNGEQDLERASVRVSNGKIISGKATEKLEAMLKERKIAFELYERISIEDPNALKLDLKLPEKPNLVYNPNN
jgi:hypothetical protein